MKQKLKALLKEAREYFLDEPLKVSGWALTLLAFFLFIGSVWTGGEFSTRLAQTGMVVLVLNVVVWVRQAN